jgi:hypothetical protein
MVPNNERAMNLKASCFQCLFLLALMSAFTARAAVLTHRYSFDSDASDVINGANGVLQGNAVIANGALVLDGTNSSVRLPNDLFTNYDSISFEVWYADGAVSNPNNQLYNFSGAYGGMYYCLFGQGNHFVGASSNLVSLQIPAVGGTNHLVWTQDSASQTARIYVNGTLAAQSVGFTNTPAMIGSTTNNLIGAGATNVAALNFKGSILEFRTYQGALSPLDAAVLDAFGPDQPQLNPGALQAVRVVIPSPTGPEALFRAGVFADFSGVTNVNISTQPDLVLTSDNTNVIEFAPDQRLRTTKLGVANITAAWQGFSNAVPVTVAVPQDIALVHRYGFNEQTNDWIVHDSVGGAHGQLFNTGAHGTTNGVFTGKGEMKLAGGYMRGGGNGGYAALPPGIISCLSEVTVETWVTWTPGNVPLTYGYGAWQRIFDFGAQSGAQGTSYLFLTPATDNVSFTTKSLLHTAITTNLNVNETPRLNWTNTLPTNVLSQVVVAYSPVRRVMKMYLNGKLFASGTATLPLSGIVDTNNFLGKSLFSNDAYFFGRFNEFRIYSGLLSDSDVAADYAAGPDTVGVDYVLHNYSSSNALTITWGPSATNLVLQSSPLLGAGAVWNQFPTAPILQNGRYAVTVPISDGAAYFRLHTP